MFRIAPPLIAVSALLAGPGAPAASWHVASEVSWHDNVTNAERPEDLLPALQWRTELETGVTRNLPDGHRFRGGGGLRAESWPRFAGLDFAAPFAAVAWEFKPGLGQYRPVLALEGEGEGRIARESERGGVGGAGRFSVRQRLGATWVLQVGQEWRRFEAKGRAFDLTARGWSGRVEWTPDDRWALAGEVRERYGDVVSYSGPPRPDLAALGKPITFVDTFEQPVPWIAYYFKARTRSAALEFSRKTGRSSLRLRHEYRETLHAGPGYRNRITSLRIASPF